MTTETTLLVEQRLRQLFQHLGIDRAHVAGRSPNDWRGFATTFPEMVASLTLLGPMFVDPQNIAHLASRLLVITGDQGPTAENVRAAMARLEKSSVVFLPGYSLLGWSDLVADRPDEISSALLQFLGQVASPPLITLTGAMLFDERRRLVDLAAKHRLPAVYFGGREFVDAEGLMSYGANYSAGWWQIASLVDKILKGAKPADLPVEQPTKFQLVINLKTAKALGLEVPPQLIAQADELIE